VDECPYVGVECDVITDVITSMFAFLNVRCIFNKITLRLCIGRSEPLQPYIARFEGPPQNVALMILTPQSKKQFPRVRRAGGDTGAIAVIRYPEFALGI